MSKYPMNSGKKTDRESRFTTQRGGFKLLDKDGKEVKKKAKS